MAMNRCLVLLFALFALLSLCHAGQIEKAELKTCRGCRLNHLRLVRDFVYNQGHANSYPDLKLTFIQGHSPTMYFYDAEGALVEEHDLSPLDTNAIHDLLKSKGFTQKEMEPREL